MYTNRDTNLFARTIWPSGLRRWLKTPVRKGMGSNPTAVTDVFFSCSWCQRGSSILSCARVLARLLVSFLRCCNWEGASSNV